VNIVAEIHQADRAALEIGMELARVVGHLGCVMMNAEAHVQRPQAGPELLQRVRLREQFFVCLFAADRIGIAVENEKARLARHLGRLQ
jgi:hypothetical protein